MNAWRTKHTHARTTQLKPMLLSAAARAAVMWPERASLRCVITHVPACVLGLGRARATQAHSLATNHLHGQACVCVCVCRVGITP